MFYNTSKSLAAAFSNYNTIADTVIKNVTFIIFKNSAARGKKFSFFSYILRADEKILSLVRADAWIDTCVLLLNLPDWK